MLKAPYMIGKAAVFLDRDGTINEDPGYLSDPDQMKLLPQVGEALALLKQKGFQLVVVSNQSGVGRGLIQESRLPKIHARLDELLKPFGAQIDAYELCFHHPKDDCECRKPKPKLILDAAQKLGVDVSRSFMVGDKVSDIGAGRQARCGGVALVRTGAGEESVAMMAKTPMGDHPDFVGSNLKEVAEWIIKKTKS